MMYLFLEGRVKMMAFDYSKLRGRITEKCGTIGIFSKRIGISQLTAGKKLNGKSDWSQDEIVKACNVLDIRICEVPDYFFTPKF